MELQYTSIIQIINILYDLHYVTTIKHFKSTSHVQKDVLKEQTASAGVTQRSGVKITGLGGGDTGEESMSKLMSSDYT